MEYYIVLVNGQEEYEDIDKKMAEWVADGYLIKGYKDVKVEHIKEDEFILQDIIHSQINKALKIKGEK